MHRLTDNLDLSTQRVWGAETPVAIHDAVLLRVVEQDGRVVMSARLTRPLIVIAVRAIRPRVTTVVRRGRIWLMPPALPINGPTSRT
jgi:hypothetical protein